MDDRYLRSFKGVKKRARFNRARKEKLVCDAKMNTFDIKRARDLVMKAKKKELSSKERNYVMKVIKKMMKSRKKEFGVCYGYYILLGAEYAEKIGEGDNPFVKRNLLKAYKKDPGMFDPDRLERFFVKNNENYSGIRKFIHNLFPRMNYVVLLSAFYLILGLFFFSANFTGFVVGGQTSYSNLLGVIFFFLGIIGVFIYFKKKNS